MKVYPENKKHDLCVISIENQFLVSFSLDPALYYAMPRHNPRSDFFKKVLNRAQGLKEKSHEVSARKNNNRLRYNKKCWGGRFHPPALLGLIHTQTNSSPLLSPTERHTVSEYLILRPIISENKYPSH